MKWTEPSANSQFAPPVCRLQKCKLSHSLVTLPCAYTCGSGHALPPCGSPNRFSADSAESNDGQVHQPQVRLAAGGRSPIIAVLLVPSVMSVSRVRELPYKTPSVGRPTPPTAEA